MKTIKIEIDCGENTCASVPGKFCKFLGSMRFGTINVCMLFNDETSHTVLEDKDGWIQRCPKCIEHTK